MSQRVEYMTCAYKQTHLHDNIQTSAIHAVDTHSCKLFMAYAKTPLLLVKELEYFIEGQAASQTKIISLALHYWNIANWNYFGEEEDKLLPQPHVYDATHVQKWYHTY